MVRKEVSILGLPKETPSPVNGIDVLFRPNMESVSQDSPRVLSAHDPDIHGVVDVLLPNLLNGRPPEYFPLVFGICPIYPFPLNIGVQGLVSSGLNYVHSVVDLETFEIKSDRINS